MFDQVTLLFACSAAYLLILSLGLIPFSAIPELSKAQRA
jgi:hypothetical protein